MNFEQRLTNIKWRYDIMLKIECTCGNRGYVEYVDKLSDRTLITLDIDTMNLEYDNYEIIFICPKCKTKYEIIRVQ
jgi:hypothetical protein